MFFSPCMCTLFQNVSCVNLYTQLRGWRENGCGTRIITHKKRRMLERMNDFTPLWDIVGTPAKWWNTCLRKWPLRWPQIELDGSHLASACVAESGGGASGALHAAWAPWQAVIMWHNPRVEASFSKKIEKPSRVGGKAEYSNEMQTVAIWDVPLVLWKSQMGDWLAPSKKTWDSIATEQCKMMNLPHRCLNRTANRKEETKTQEAIWERFWSNGKHLVFLFCLFSYFWKYNCIFTDPFLPLSCELGCSILPWTMFAVSPGIKISPQVSRKLYMSTIVLIAPA